MSSSTQKRNPERSDLLESEFQKRYEPNFAWVNALSAFTLLPGLRGFWPMSAVGDSVGGVNSDVTDLSGQGRHLTNVGQAQFGSNAAQPLVPFGEYDGTNDYLSRADEAGLDIIGTEAYIRSPNRGLTMGGWYKFDTFPTTGNWGIMGKWVGSTNNRSYLLYLPTGGSVADFRVSVDGTAVTNIASTFTLSVDTWYFIIGRYDTNNLMSVSVNGTANEDTLAVGVPASIFNSTSQFNIMAFTNGAVANRTGGDASLSFLCASYLRDATVNALYHQTRAMFGV